MMLSRRLLSSVARQPQLRRFALPTARCFSAEAVPSKDQDDANDPRHLIPVSQEETIKILKETYEPTLPPELEQYRPKIWDTDLNNDKERVNFEQSTALFNTWERAAKTAGPPMGFLDMVGLGTFSRKATLVVTGAITLVQNEIYVLNEETYVAACILAGFTVMWVNLREPFMDAFSARSKEIFDAENDAQTQHIGAASATVEATNTSEADQLVDAVKGVFAEKEELVHLEAAARAIAEKNKVAKDFDAKLQTLVNRKNEEENKAYKELIDRVYGEVLEATGDAKFKKAALKYALTAIATPEKAGQNPTVELFESKLK